MIAGAIACPVSALEKSPLALGINVSAPLIDLNNLVQGSPSDSFNFRNGTSFEVGLDHVPRDSAVLGLVVTVTVLAQKLWRRPGNTNGASDRKRAKQTAGLDQHSAMHYDRITAQLNAVARQTYAYYPPRAEA